MPPPSPAAAGHCRQHPDVPAAMSCSQCLAPLCGECLLFFHSEIVCSSCVRTLRAKRDSRHGLIALAAGVGVLVVILGISALVYLARSTYDYGRVAPVVQAARGQLEKSPCDRAAEIELCDAMAEAGDARGTIATAQAFFRRCGEEPRVRWATYTAHKQLGEWDDAIADATRLVESEPEDKDYRWWRAQAWERKGRLDNAATDYEKAIELEPQLTSIPINLASVYERMHRPCDAARVLHTYGEVHPDVVETLRPRVASLDKSCKAGTP